MRWNKSYANYAECDDRPGGHCIFGGAPGAGLRPSVSVCARVPCLRVPSPFCFCVLVRRSSSDRDLQMDLGRRSGESTPSSGRARAPPAGSQRAPRYARLRPPRPNGQPFTAPTSLPHSCLSTAYLAATLWLPYGYYFAHWRGVDTGHVWVGGGPLRAACRSRDSAGKTSLPESG